MKRMAQFESRERDIEAAGARLAFVAAEKRDGVWKPGKFLTKHPISPPFLLDEDRVVTKAYGVHNALAADALNIAHPATFVIDRGAVVRYIYRGENQHDRAPIDEVLKVAQQVRV
ncbi:MAG: redoxin domain-containing protein [Terriglobales bacterium]